MQLCVCLRCDPTGRRFKAAFGRFPWEPRHRRRTHEEVVAERRKRQEVLAMERALRARYYGPESS